MKRVIVRYKVDPTRVNENQALIWAVFAELKEKKPTGLRYASFLQEDGQSFVHVASVETADGSNPLSEIQAFKAFQQDIKSRCIEPPVAAGLTEIGSYGLFDE